MYDGTLKFDTSLDDSGFEGGLSKLGSIAKAGLNAVAGAAQWAAGEVVKIGINAIEAGKGFESGMAQVAATMGITKDTIEGGVNSYELLKKAAADAGETTTFSASEAADALNYLALAGYDAATAASALPSVLNLAAAGGLELGYASDLATDAMSALGIVANDTNLTKFGDELAKTSQKSNTSVAQLGEAILTVGGTAKDLANGTAELNASLGVLANIGIKGSEGGTALRNIMLAMTPTTDKAAEAFDRLNLSAYDADGNLRPLNETFRDMGKAMEGMSSQEKTEMLNNMFNKVDLKAVSGMLAACASSTEELGTAFLAAGVPADNLNEFLDNFNNKLYNTMTEEEFAKSVMDDFGVSAEEASSVYGAFTTQLNGISFESLYNEIENCNGAMSDMADTMNDTLDGDIKSLQSKIEAFGIAVYEDMNEPLRELAQSGGNYVSQLTEAFREGSFEGITATVGDVLSQIVTQITGYAPKLAELGSSVILNLIGGITKNAESLTKSAFQVISVLVNAVFSAVPQLLECGYIIVKTLITSIIDELPLFLELGLTLIEDLAQTILDNIPELIETASQLVTKLCDFLIESVPMLLDAAVQLFESIVDAFPKIIETLKDKTPEIIQTVLDVFPQLISVINGAVPDIIEAITTALPIIITSLAEMLPEIVTSVIDVLFSFQNEMLETSIILFSSLVDALPVILDALLEQLPTIIEAVIITLIKATPQVAESSLKLFMAFVEAIPKVAKKLGEGMLSLWNSLKDWVTKIGKDLIDKGRNASKNMIDAIADGITSRFSKMADVGKNLVHGLWNGISGAKDWLKDKISGYGNSIIDGFKKAFGIHSPSAIMRDEVGKYLAQGMGVGFSDEIPDVFKGITKVTDDAVSQLNRHSISMNTLTAPSASEIVNNYSYTATGVSDASQTIIVNAKLEIDGETVAEGVKSIVVDEVDRQQGINIRLRKRGLAT